jgi:hypothetical protein
MKDIDFPVEPGPVPPVAPNGTHRSSKKNAAAPKVSARSGASTAVRNGARKSGRPEARQALDAAFAEIETKPSDASMWPLHSVLWLQPERAAQIPAWTGLGTERHNRIPRPDLLPVESPPADHPDTPDKSCVAIMPRPHCQLPRSDLAPLGWDPRTVCRKESNQ